MHQISVHPGNTHHSLRIPRSARSWSSDVLQPGNQFDVTLTVPGVYDYFRAPHETAGRVVALSGSRSDPVTSNLIGPGTRSGSADDYRFHLQHENISVNPGNYAAYLPDWTIWSTDPQTA